MVRFPVSTFFRQKICDETDIFAAEEAIRQREMKLLMEKHRKSAETLPPPPTLAQKFDEPKTRLAKGREQWKAMLQTISTQNIDGSVAALKKNDLKIDVRIEALNQVTDQLNKNVTDLLADRN